MRSGEKSRTEMVQVIDYILLDVVNFSGYDIKNVVFLDSTNWFMIFYLEPLAPFPAAVLPPSRLPQPLRFTATLVQRAGVGTVIFGWQLTPSLDFINFLMC